MMDTIPFGDLRRQYESIKPELDEAAARVLASGWYILGPEVRAFEAEFAAFCGVGHAIARADDKIVDVEAMQYPMHDGRQHDAAGQHDDEPGIERVAPGEKLAGVGLELVGRPHA